MEPNQFTNLLPMEGTLTQDGQKILEGVRATRITSGDQTFNSICFSEIDSDDYKFIISIISIPTGVKPKRVIDGKIIAIGEPSKTCVRGLLVSFPHRNEAELGFKFSDVTDHFCAQ